MGAIYEELSQSIKGWANSLGIESGQPAPAQQQVEVKNPILSDEGGIFDILAGRYSSGIPNLDLHISVIVCLQAVSRRILRVLFIEKDFSWLRVRRTIALALMQIGRRGETGR